MVMMMQCAQISRDRGINPVFSPLHLDSKTAQFTWAVFCIQTHKMWQRLCVDQLTVCSMDVFKLDEIAFSIGGSRSYLH